MEDPKNKRGRPQKYVFWSDWEKWLLTQWFPFKQNDLPHLQNDVAWLKKLTVGILFVILAAALALLLR